MQVQVHTEKVREIQVTYLVRFRFRGGGFQGVKGVQDAGRWPMGTVKVVARVDGWWTVDGGWWMIVGGVFACSIYLLLIGNLVYAYALIVFFSSSLITLHLPPVTAELGWVWSCSVAALQDKREGHDGSRPRQQLGEQPGALPNLGGL